ncbi:MAG: sugar phosphate isomerase/epimerase [Acidobacteria bacterium]|nr:sugar phosphate isomerase/epimerase [Acidobacteriota bacterium]
MSITRRSFTEITAAAAAAGSLGIGHAAKINAVHGGVTLGAQSYSFRDRDLDAAIAAMKEVGIGTVEMWSGHVEPKGLKREDARKWRLSVDLKELNAVRKKYDAAGIELYAYNYSVREDYSDEEIDRGFQMAKALGVKVITASANVSTAKRIDRFAAKHKIRVGMHNHSRIHANEFARAEDFAEAMNGASEYIAVNLDIGHFWAANFNPVDYLRNNHQRIVTLHIKDRKKDQGPNMPFGAGDTPIKAVLETMRELKLKMPANIEYEYKGADTVVEMKKCLAYCKSALGA